MPQDPIFRSWPVNPDAHVPVDDEINQVAWVRVSRPGPIRVLANSLVALASVWIGLASLLAVFAGQNLFTRAVVGVIAAALTAAALWLALRVWTVGLYVNDAGLRITRLRSSRLLPWHSVAAIRVVPTRERPLGLPFRVSARRVVAEVVTGEGMDSVATGMTSVSQDFLWREEAFETAASRVARWSASPRGAP